MEIPRYSFPGPVCSVQGELFIDGLFRSPSTLARRFDDTFFTLSPAASRAQGNSPGYGETQSSNTASSSRAASSTHAAPDPAALEVYWREVLARSERHVAFPVKVAEGKHWLPTTIIAGGTAVLIKEDPLAAGRYFQRLQQ
jgi:hypothetical protein